MRAYADRFSVDEEERDGVRVLSAVGDLDLGAAPSLAVRVNAARDAHVRRVLVDLTGVEFCDSTGLRALIGAATEIRIAGGRLGVSCPDGTPVARLLDLTGARELLPVYPDVETALAALA